ncbi:putative pectin methyltransferase qua3 [Stylosanthes scabra]|uniref:Methyltransferase n=1 Tax=Stylosanthes scabra TaxID=79078 RepID=A0ABU6WJT2_9FABA|nr:putative pectin methyltransferase qua3 [Stylosanthes scabra]
MAISSKRTTNTFITALINPRQWRLLDMITAFFFFLVAIFFLMAFTHYGDSLAASGRNTLLRSSDPRHRLRLVSAIESGELRGGGVSLDACSAEEVDHMPCEDPRVNRFLSREMNFYRERHCPRHIDTPLCLIPPPKGYRIPVRWPESLHKVLSYALNSASLIFSAVLTG